MVFFTCNHCGESLKKPMVEKHYTHFKCRNAPYFLTCVDCLKDFSGNEYRDHTKCISESEKYSAKGFVAKPDGNKGAKKQEAWTEIIQTHLAKRTDLDDFTRNTMEHIAQQTNIPRKQAKFLNFVSNCLRMSPNNAQKIWKVVEKALEEFEVKVKAEREVYDAQQKAAKEVREAARAAAAAEADPEPKKSKKVKKDKGEGDEVSEKRAKKAKKAKQVSEITSTTEPEATVDESAAPKTKKSKKRPLEQEVIPNGAAKEEVDSTDKKSKKKKRKLDNAEAVAVPATFEWKRVITEVLQKKEHIKLEKLKVKVLKKLSAFNEGAEPTERDEKKYQKYFEQMAKFIRVEGETAQLIAAQ